MAAAVRGVFAEKVSPFLMEKLRVARTTPGQERVAEVLERQYERDDREESVASTDVTRHYEATLAHLVGAERIYRTTALVEPTTTCAAHCRWCLRAQYEPLQMSDAQMEAFARYCGAQERSQDLTEILVTGGDPFLVPDKLDSLFTLMMRHAPNVHKYRIGTRIPLQAPERVGSKLLDVLRRFSEHVEIGLHTNHAIELFPEVVEALQRLRRTGITIYNHTVLLRGVNDTLPELVDLCRRLRALSIETHYLFHCVPMIGMRHHRTSLRRGLELARQLANSGEISGRSRPVFALLTAVGKVVPYESTILAREGTRILLQTEFTAHERMQLNPMWRVPENAIVGDDGRLRVWYEDAPDAG
jgi:lysine 2,3-aminomutase